jgi:arylsulfatase
MNEHSSLPNFIFFMVDQLGAKWLELAEHGICPTPNIDRLRRMGVSFNSMYTNNPVCCASRASMATGLTSRSHGVLENGYNLDPALPNFMQALQQAGWRTGAFGKVHFLAHFAGLYPDYRPYGFDVVYNTEDSRGGEWLDWVKQHYPEYYDEALATVWTSDIPEFAEYGPDEENLREKIEKIRSEFRWDTEKFPHSTDFAYPLPFPKEVSQTGWITMHALDYINKTPKEQPLFAQISYIQPHSPFCAPEEFMDQVRLDRMPQPLPAEWLTDPHAPAYFNKKKPMEMNWDFARQLYFADITYLDQELGRVLTALEDTGRLENTYIFFVSDHGEMLGDHGFAGKEERHYDACIRVPLIIAGPNMAEGVVCKQFVELDDICPTVLELAGVQLPLVPKQGDHLKVEPEQIPFINGKSLVALCKGENPGIWREEVYVESYNSIWSMDPGDWARTIRTNRFRYTYYPNGNGEQLFDLIADPDEQINLKGDVNYTEILRDLKDRLMELIIMQDYPKTRRNLYAMGVH